MLIDVMRPPSLEELFRAHYAPLLRAVGLLVDDLADAEDVVQDAFARTARSLTTIVDPAAYLRTTAFNGARGRLRRLRVVRAHPPEALAPVASAEAISNADRPVVMAALRRLPRRQRECVVLRYYLDLAERDIAETLGISLGSVKTHSSRARAALATALEDLR